MVARSYAFNRATLTRLHTLCNAHLSLGEEAWGSKTVKSIQVLKSGNIERRTGNTVVFDVVPDVWNPGHTWGQDKDIVADPSAPL